MPSNFQFDFFSERGEIRAANEYTNEPNLNINVTINTNTTADSTKKKKGTKPQKAKPKQETKPSTSNTNKPTPKPDVTSAIDDQSARQEVHDRFQKQLQDFMADKSKTEWNFPPSLNSFERMMVHQVAEELGLIHESKGQDDGRYISVRKRMPKQEQPKPQPQSEKKPSVPQEAPVVTGSAFNALEDQTEVEDEETQEAPNGTSAETSQKKKKKKKKKEAPETDSNKNTSVLQNNINKIEQLSEDEALEAAIQQYEPIGLY